MPKMDQEQITIMAYRSGRLTEINPNEDLFLKRLIEANLKDESDSDPDVDYVIQHLSRTGFSHLDSFGVDRDVLHAVWKNGKKYLIILNECETGPFAFVKLESHVEYMDFARDYLLPIIELESRSEFFMPKKQ